MILFDVCHIIYFYNTLCKVTVPKLQFLLSMAHLFVEYTVKFAIWYFCNREYVKKEKFNFSNVLCLNRKIFSTFFATMRFCETKDSEDCCMEFVLFQNISCTVWWFGIKLSIKVQCLEIQPDLLILNNVSQFLKLWFFFLYNVCFYFFLYQKSWFSLHCN